MEQPTPGTSVEIQSYKHDGTLHRVWHQSSILYSSDTTVIGANDQTMVIESDGSEWQTREPAIVYFSTQVWFNIIAMIRNDGNYFYCNLGSPVTWDEEALKYIDYDLDIKVFPDMSYRLLDEDEYSLHKKEMNYPQKLDTILKRHVRELESWITERKGPFEKGFVEKWYNEYKKQNQG